MVGLASFPGSSPRTAQERLPEVGVNQPSCVVVVPTEGIEPPLDPSFRARRHRPACVGDIYFPRATASSGSSAFRYVGSSFSISFSCSSSVQA